MCCARLITEDRLTPDERGVDASMRQLLEHARGLGQDELRALSYVAERFRLAPSGLSVRAAERKAPRWRRKAAPKRR